MSEKAETKGHAGEHSDHVHEVFDAEPAQELGPGEPETPLWLPVVGLAAFALVAVWWTVTGEDEAATGKPADTAAAATAVAAAPARPPERPTVRPPADRARPSGGRAKPTVKGQLDPEALKRLKERMEAARKQQAEEQGHEVPADDD